MRKFVGAALVLLLPPSANARDQLNERGMEFCKAAESMAVAFATARQNDRPMSEVVGELADFVSKYPPIGDYFLDVAIEAYEQPKYPPQLREDAIRDFAIKQYSQCLKDFR